MRPELIAFGDEHIDEAADLLAARWRADREHAPLLPARFAEPAVARVAVAAAWRVEGARGVVALANGRMVGYLIGAPQIDTRDGRMAVVALAGHALAAGQDADLYRDLYAALSPHWLAAGLFAHYIALPVANAAALTAWFQLSFGAERAYGLRALTDNDLTPTTMNTPQTPTRDGEADQTLTIRRATPDDLEAAIAVADTIFRYQAGPPIYAPFPPEEMQPTELRADFSQFLADADVALWLAWRGKRVIGYQLYLPELPNDAQPLVPERCVELALGASLPDARGQGVGRALTARGLAWARQSGYDVCLADWRTANLLASRFWPRQGFRPTVYRLVRRIDERIAWARR